MLVWLAIPVLLVFALKLWARAATSYEISHVSHRASGGDAGDEMVVLVHGLGGPEKLTPIAKELSKKRDVVVIKYPVSGWHAASNADPEKIAEQIARKIQELSAAHGRVVLVGHSMGSPLSRRAYLHSLETKPEQGWATRVERIVLLAGLNRGLDITGNRPSDMGVGRFLQIWLTTWVGQVTGTMGFPRQLEAGSPFVANLRLDWVRYVAAAAGGDPYNSARASGPEVVQLLGDIDDLVEAEDSTDLQAGGEDFIWMRVRGTGHAEILRISDKDSFGPYRKAKILRAIDSPMEDLRRENEELPTAIDPSVKRVVFVVHGIRDLGRWSANFEEALRKRYQELGRTDRLVIASPRYHYFGMGPFLLPFERQKYVHWLMDEITMTRARYPNAARFDFIGHSNGTYLLAKALKDYRSLKMNKVVFAGSVARRNYDWKSRFDDDQVRSVVNITAASDWVVALFPRFFELPLVRALGNEIGSAGFNGFSSNLVENVGPIPGGHGAFRGHVHSLVDYVLPPRRLSVGADAGAVAMSLPSVEKDPVLAVVSRWLVPLVWLLIVGLLGGVGLWLVGSGRQFAIPIAGAYLVLLVLLLRRI